MAQPQGEAQGYYQEGAPQYVQQPQQQQQQPYEQKNYQKQQQQQQPPQYGNYAPQNYDAGGEKQDFSQAFKLDKPKFNDWWAGLLVSFAR
jgi:hypothetical protein